MEYPKIKTLFERDGKFVVTDKLQHPVYGTIADWEVSEKIDGTNIRITLTEQGEVIFGGRTDAAQIPADLVQHLIRTFPAEKMKAALWQPDKSGEIKPAKYILYGEGYGAGIQKGGGLYRSDKSFRLFDVLVGDRWWLDRKNMTDIADKLGIKYAPLVGYMRIDQIVDIVRDGFGSGVSVDDSNQQKVAEGIIARPIEPLFHANGSRVMFKLKTIDFQRQT